MSDLALHFDQVADNDAKVRRRQRGFHRQLIAYHHRHIPSGASVLEWGCGAGALLRALRPRRGLGIDMSPRMISRANAKMAVAEGDNPSSCEFRIGDILHDKVDQKFDHIILSFLTGYLPDIQTSLERVHSSAITTTRLHITSLNILWLTPLRLAAKWGWVSPQPDSNWLSRDDITNLLELAGWEVVSQTTEQLCPVRLPVLEGLFNRCLVRLPVFQHLGVTIALVARPRQKPVFTGEISCSVIVPARNEAGNIRAALERIPLLGRRTEVIFVEGNSSDDTWATIEREIALYKGPLDVSALKQPGRGKWDAVYTGFAVAKGDILVIQDADLTAPPEDLPKFYTAIQDGLAEFANGSRLVYPMEKKAMRFLNLLGNKFFALALSYVLGQPIKDSLCGTKMISRQHYIKLLTAIEALGKFDPFGDFNLLFGAAMMDLKIRDIPVRYRDRSYGETNISRFRHGWLLFKMTLFGLFRLRWR